MGILLAKSEPVQGKSVGGHAYIERIKACLYVAGASDRYDRIGQRKMSLQRQF